MKKFWCAFLSVLLCIAVITPTFAAAVAGNKGDDAITDQEVLDYALYFMSNSQAGRALEIRDFIHLTDGRGTDTGYYISFSVDGTPTGYIILSLLTEGSPVVEFSFEGEGPIEAASTSAISKDNAASYSRNAQAEVIYTGAESLYIPLQSGEFFSPYQQEIVNISEMSEFFGNKANPQLIDGGVNLYDGVLDWSAANIKQGSDFKIENIGVGTDYWTMDDFDDDGKYTNHCAPTAGTNILWYWGFKRGCSSITNKVSAQQNNEDKAAVIFDLLRIGMRTNNTSGTSRSNIIGGYTEFFGRTSRGVWGHVEIKNGSSFDQFETMLRRDLPIHLSVHTTSIPTTNSVGHSLMAIGVAKSVSGEDYIFVMDGWNKYGRFVKFSYYPFVAGYVIYVNQ